jgi:hypothetical protein
MFHHFSVLCRNSLVGQDLLRLQATGHAYKRVDRTQMWMWQATQATSHIFHVNAAHLELPGF